MILKEKESLSGTSGRAVAGDKQEKDAAFFLRREFGKDESVRIINDLNVWHEGEKAQIDHLVVHPYGFIVIESKSIYGEVKVNAEGEWSRSYRGEWRGMASPIRQAELQQALLKDFLGSHVEEFLGKVLGLQTRLGGRDWQNLCAISSSAILHRAGLPKAISSQVVKTEFLGEKVRSISNPTVGGLLTGKPRFSQKEMEDIGSFLLDHHRGAMSEPVRDLPQNPTSEQKSSFPDASANVPDGKTGQRMAGAWRLACKACGETMRLSGQHGRYGYFVKCDECGTNTPMKMPCSNCGGKRVRVSKSGPTYTSTCQACGQTRVVFEATLGA